MRRYLIPALAFLLGASGIAVVYFGILTWAQGWDSAIAIFHSNREYVVAIWLSFGVQAAVYSILRFRLLSSASMSAHPGAVVGTSGSTSTAAMVACCLHHVTDVLPVLGLSAAASFLTRYQRPFMLIGVVINLVGIVLMWFVLDRERRKLQATQKLHPVLEIE